MEKYKNPRLTTFTASLLAIACSLIFFTSTSQAADPILFEAECRICHSSGLVDRHHIQGQQDGLECLDCHGFTWNNATSAYEVEVFRDCLKCHDAGNEHHTLRIKEAGNACFDCHRYVLDTDTARYKVGFTFSVIRPL